MRAQEISTIKFQDMHIGIDVLCIGEDLTAETRSSKFATTAAER
jgi:hypothetical protein